MTESIEAKIEKMLRVADGTANENESAVALAMAQKLADAHNLDLGVIGKSGGRADKNVSKGLYQYQRTLYTDIAELNHCRAWVSKGINKGDKYKIRLLGSKANVAVTINICDYVEEVANRLVRENMSHVNYFSKDAHYYREGVIDRMVARIRIRRREEEEERERLKREQAARMAHPSAATENAIVLMSDVAEREAKANWDYLNGEGSWDAMKQREREAQERREQAAREYEAWALANPEEVARQEARRKEEQERYAKEYEKRRDAAAKRRQKRINEYGYDPQDYRRTKRTKYDSTAYYQGQNDGSSVSIDDQISKETREALK